MLDRISPDLKARICEWQGSAAPIAENVQSVLAILEQSMALAKGKYPAAWGDLPLYFAAKTRWMIAKGRYDDAFGLMWGAVGVLDFLAGRVDDAEMSSDARRLARDWLQAVGWEGQEVLEEKVRMAEGMAAEIEAMAAHLPLDGAPASQARSWRT